MKAKNIKTREVVTDFAFSKEFGTVSYIDSHGVLRFGNPCDGEWKIIEESDGGFDWVKWRNDAARDVLCALLNGHESPIDLYENQVFVAEAINIADELVKRLKTNK